MVEKRTKQDRAGTCYRKGPFAQTDSSEVTSIKIFESLIDEHCVKTLLEKRDKYPNTDGYVEPVTADNRSIGKIHVQVKTLSESDIKRRGYSCDEGFLGHCKDALEPTILVGVDQSESKAFWVEVTPSMVADMEKLGSLTVKFPDSNVISGDNKEYYDAWKLMIERRKNVFRLFSPYAEEIERTRVARQHLKDGIGGIPVENIVDVPKVQRFLDEYNRLMSQDFATLKNLLFSNVRKFGFAYSQYEDSRLIYTVYGIDQQSTDADIKKLSDQSMRAMFEEGTTLRGHNTKNPIEENPERLARSLIKEELHNFIGKGWMPSLTIDLARELCFDLLDKAHAQFGLQRANCYQVDDISFGLNEFMPRWVGNVLCMCPAQQLQSMLQTLSWSQYLDIHLMEFGMPRRELTRIYEKTKIDLTNHTPSFVQLPLGCGDLPLGLLPDSLVLLSNSGYKKVERLYPNYDYSRTPNNPWVYNRLSPAELIRKVQVFCNSLPMAYDTVVTNSFPSLQSEIKYSRDYNRQVVIVTASEQYTDVDRFPSIKFLNLKSQDEDHELITDVYAHDDTRRPKLDFGDFDKDIILDSKRYKLVSGCSSAADKFFRPLLLFQAIQERLLKSFDHLFDRWDSNHA
jgi:hypothetical protein